jgi:hypothetical protein
MRPISTFGWLAAVVVLSPVSCSAGDPGTGCGPDEVAAIASDVVVVTNDEAALYFAVADPLSPDESDVSAAPVAAAAATYFPGACAAVTADGNVATIQLDDCSGPLGLTHATGTVTAKILADGAGQLLIQLSGDSVSANGGVYTLNTSAVLTAASDGQKTLLASSMSNGQGADGNSVDHAGSFALVWSANTSCATLNANFSSITTGEYGSANMAIVDYVACTGGCPRSGTVANSFNGGSVTLVYDGAPYAFCSASNGRSAALAIECP